MQKMVQLISNKIILLVFLFNGVFMLKLTAQVNSNNGRMVPGKAISAEENIRVDKYFLKYKIVLVETAQRDTIGLLYDSTALRKSKNMPRILKDSTYLFNVVNPEGIDVDFKNFDLYFVNNFISLYNHIWLKYVDAYRGSK